MLSAGFLLHGRYHITRRLGSGGFATVYLAEDNRLGNRKVAVKEFDAAKLPAADRDWARQSFQNEAYVLSTLRHESIASVTDFFSVGGLDYLVMEYVEGETLTQAWQRVGGRFHHDQVLTWAQELCQALGYLHRRNPPIIFRDLKPDNIMVQPNGRLKLIDFGIARHLKPNQVRDTQVLGTPGYAAPEQYGTQQTDARADIYSLGVVLHQLLTGYDPSDSPLNLPPIRSLNQQVPTHVAKVIHTALDLNPDGRFSHMSDFAAALASSRAAFSMPGWLWPALGIFLVASVVAGVFLWGDVFALTENTLVTVVNTQVVTVTNSSEVVTPSSTADNTPPLVTPTTETPSPTSLPTATSTPSVTPVTNQNRPILFDSTRNDLDGFAEIFIMNADGSNPRRLTTNSVQDDDADLSPDSQWIAFDRGASGTESLWIMRADGSAARSLVRGRLPDWSPDGRYLAYESLDNIPQLWILDVNSGTTRQLTNSERPYRAADWSPDGSEIVAMSQFGDDWQIMIINVANGAERQITSGGGDKRYPVWSPDGGLIAYNTLTSSGWPDDVWVVEPSGSGARAITSSGNNGRPTWSPDGQYLLFNSYINERWVLYQVDLNGQQGRQLTTEGSDQRASWSN